MYCEYWELYDAQPPSDDKTAAFLPIKEYRERYRSTRIHFDIANWAVGAATFLAVCGQAPRAPLAVVRPLRAPQ